MNPIRTTARPDLRAHAATRMPAPGSRARERLRRTTPSTESGGRAPARAPAPSPAPFPSGTRLTRARLASPFAPGREIAFARVEGGALEKLGLRDGDHVALAREAEIEAPGAAPEPASATGRELATLVGPDGTAALWSVQREGTRLRYGTGDRATERLSERHARVAGVVVAVLRRDP